MLVPRPFSHDHHERRVGLVEVREIMKGGELIERTEVADRRAAAEGDDDAVLHARGERIAARGELRCGDLSDGHGRQATSSDASIPARIRERERTSVGMRSPDGDMSLPRNDIGRESGISRRAQVRRQVGASQTVTRARRCGPPMRARHFLPT